jgi:hypothetical protein
MYLELGKQDLEAVVVTVWVCVDSILFRVELSFQLLALFG